MPEVFGRFLLIEVDSDKEPSPLRDENSRRKRFYRNLGCREVASLDYVMPPVTAHAPPAMDIMAFGRPLPKAITKFQLLEWLQSIYVNEYGLQATDIRIEQMLGKNAVFRWAAGGRFYCELDARACAKEIWCLGLIDVEA